MNPAVKTIKATSTAVTRSRFLTANQTGRKTKGAHSSQDSVAMNRTRSIPKLANSSHFLHFGTRNRPWSSHPASYGLYMYTSASFSSSFEGGLGRGRWASEWEGCRFFLVRSEMYESSMSAPEEDGE